MPTKIDWCDEVWNPVTGCTKISPGCDHCYAERMAKRLAGRCGYLKNNPFKITLHPERLSIPLRWRKPRRIFVNSMGDLFHEQVATQWVDDVLEVIAACPHHTFMILTKRPKNIDEKLYGIKATHGCRVLGGGDYLPNLWLGVTVENQMMADQRIPVLLRVPAAKRFVSIEPMLGPVEIPHLVRPYHRLPFSYPHWIDWVICGGETGPGARPMMSEWVESLRDQCVDAGVPFFFKGWGTALRPKDATYQLIEGREWKQFPEK